MHIIKAGTQPSSDGPASHFTGRVRVDPLFSSVPPARAKGAKVTFEPGARTHWHSHPLGQILLVTQGRGHVQSWGGAVETVTEGDCICFAPGEKHWHGASATTAMTHLAVSEPFEGNSVTWMEPVSDSQYPG